jgi:hypothetical protein
VYGDAADVDAQSVVRHRSAAAGVSVEGVISCSTPLIMARNCWCRFWITFHGAADGIAWPSTRDHMAVPLRAPPAVSKMPKRIRAQKRGQPGSISSSCERILH